MNGIPGPAPRTMRLFLALGLPYDLREIVLQAQTRLRASIHQGGGRVRWSRPDGLHITLAFLGDIDEQRIERLDDVVAAVVRHIPPLRITLHGMGYFGRPQPAALWAGVERDAALAEFQTTLGAALVRGGFPAQDESRGFTPHITLGRVKHWPRFLRLQDQFGFDASYHFGTFQAHELSLYRSELLEDGSRYSVVHEWELTGRPKAPSLHPPLVEARVRPTTHRRGALQVSSNGGSGPVGLG